MPPSKARRGAPRAARQGLALTAESPVRPLASFLISRRGANGDGSSPTGAASQASGTGEKKDVPADGVFTHPSTIRKGKERLSQSAPSEHERLSKQHERAASSAHSMLWSDTDIDIPKGRLAIHKKKIEQVEGWLRDALDGKTSLRKYRRILVLHGPAGAGKSTLVRSLARADALDFRIIDWNDDAQAQSTTNGWDQGRAYTQRSNERSEGAEGGPSFAASDRFGNFLAGASKSSWLELDDGDGLTGGSVAQESVGKGLVSALSSQVRNSSAQRGILLIDDMPNLFHGPTRKAFHNTLERFVDVSSSARKMPLVICITETSLRLDDWGGNHAIGNWKDRTEDDLSVRSVVPESLRNHPAVVQIPFNNVAPTIMRKGLRSILETTKTGDAYTVPTPASTNAKELIEAIVLTSNGDLRSAINTLQFVLSGPKPESPPRGLKRKTNGEDKRRKQQQSMRATLSAATGREASLAVFHALGKVLYNKRLGDTPDEEGDEEDQPDSDGTQDQSPAHLDFCIPWHLQALDRRRSKVDVEALWRSMPLDASTLQAFVHQNYTPFCDTIEQCADLVTGLSDAEALKPAYEEWLHAGLTQYYSFLVSTHSTLLALPSPVVHRKEQRFSGAALFQVQKHQRSSLQAIAELKSAVAQRVTTNLGAQQEQMKPASISNILGDCRGDQLACDVLPYLSKCCPGKLPASLAKIATMSWSVDEGDKGLHHGIGIDPLEGDVYSTLAEQQLGGTVATLDPLMAELTEGHLYDEEGSRVKVETVRPSEISRERLVSFDAAIVARADGASPRHVDQHDMRDNNESDDTMSNASFQESIQDSD